MSYLYLSVVDLYFKFSDSVCRLYEAGTRRPLAFSPSTDMGLTDIEMAHNMDYDDPYFDDRVGYEMEYEVTINFSKLCPRTPGVVQWTINTFYMLSNFNLHNIVQLFASFNCPQHNNLHYYEGYNLVIKSTNSALFLFLLYLSTLYISYLIKKLQTKMDRQVLLCLIKQEID